MNLGLQARWSLTLHSSSSPRKVLLLMACVCLFVSDIAGKGLKLSWWNFQNRQAHDSGNSPGGSTLQSGAGRDMLCLAKHYHYSLENENYSNSDGPRIVNPLTGTLKPQSNGPLYSNAVIGRLAVEGWTVTFGTARRGLGGLRPRPVPSSLYQM